MAVYVVRKRELSVPNNSIAEFRIFGRPVLSVVNIACLAGTFAVLIIIGLFVAHITWKSMNVSQTVIVALFLHIFFCIGLAPHILLVMSVKEGDGNLIGAANYGYGTLLIVEVLILIVEVYSYGGKQRFTQHPNFPAMMHPATTSFDIQKMIVSVIIHILIAIVQVAVAIILFRCYRLFRLKQRQKEAMAKKISQQQQSSRTVSVGETRTPLLFNFATPKSSTVDPPNLSVAQNSPGGPNNGTARK